MGEVFAEAYRLRLMRGLEEGLHDLGYRRIAGVDEAGRGCLAGPVVAAAVVVEGGILVPGVDDSKQLSAARRERLAAAIRRAHPSHAVVAVGPRSIDRVNILEATRLAMIQALAALDPQPDLGLIDAVPLRTPIETLSVVRGDQISYAVACASILAKVERDQTMVELSHIYPHYGFEAHKGYGTQVHRQALIEHGPCKAHRLTFKSVLPRRDSGKSTLRTSTATSGEVEIQPQSSAPKARARKGPQGRGSKKDTRARARRREPSLFGATEGSGKESVVGSSAWP